MQYYRIGLKGVTASSPYGGNDLLPGSTRPDAVSKLHRNGEERVFAM